jgi:hypothetical protein
VVATRAARMPGPSRRKGRNGPDQTEARPGAGSRRESDQGVLLLPSDGHGRRVGIRDRCEPATTIILGINAVGLAPPIFGHQCGWSRHRPRCRRHPFHHRLCVLQLSAASLADSDCGDDEFPSASADAWIDRGRMRRAACRSHSTCRPRC